MGEDNIPLVSVLFPSLYLQNKMFVTSIIPMNSIDCTLACENGGTADVTCSSCVCPPGYTGNLCGEDVDECTFDFCLNGGTCNNTHGGFECVCVGGFTGKFCETNINECEGMSCLNGGTCVDLVNGFACSCEPPFTGLNCAGKHFFLKN